MADVTPTTAAAPGWSGFFVPTAIYIMEGLAVGYVAFAVASDLGALAASAANSWITAAQAIQMAQGVGILGFAGVALSQIKVLISKFF